MKKIAILFIIFICVLLVSYHVNLIGIDKEKKVDEVLEVDKELTEIYIQIGDYSCKAELYHNETTQELLHQFPKTYIMEEMNGNEKYYYLDKELPTSPQKVNHIKAGDIMLFGDNCLVIFYKDFLTQYTYTKLGYIKDIPEFLERLPQGQIELTFQKDF